MPELCIENVNKTIKRKPILININLTLDSGRIYGFYGRNGSGKTMLFRTITGLMLPDSGSIKIFGQQIGVDVSFPADLGIVLDSVGFWPQYTGFECLKFLASIRNLIKDDDIRCALNRVHLDWEDKRTYREYSLGMKQRLAIAQAIMEKPRLIVLDEPTNSLDEESVHAFRNLMQEEKEKGAIILIASHHKEDIRFLCDEVYQLDEGRCRLMGDML